MAIGETSVQGPLAAQPVFTNPTVNPLVCDMVAILEMVSTDVLLTGVLQGVWRWTDRLGRARSLTSQNLSVLSSTNRLEHRAIIIPGAGTIVSFEINAINIGIGSFSYDYCAGLIGTVDTLPPGL